MRNIQPIDYTGNGIMSTQLKVSILNDDLESSCNFEWKLFSDAGACTDKGIIICSGNDYLGWNGNNDFPYTYVATNIYHTLTIIS
jgi:hypothetical protein